MIKKVSPAATELTALKSKTRVHTPTYLSPVNDQGVLVGRAGFDNLTLLLQNYNVNSASLRYIGNLYGEVEITPNLRFRTSWGADYNNYDESEYWNNLLISGSPKHMRKC